MKRHINLYDAISSKDNIRSALFNSIKNKGHYSEVKQIIKNPEKYVELLNELLINNNFKNSKYTVFLKTTGHKTREIYKLPLFPDRVLHHAIVQIMMPIWINILIRDTYSTIPKRGIHDGVRRIKAALKDQPNTIYTLKLDIQKYYLNINHDILLNILNKKIKDKRLMSLFDEIIKSAQGIPIGNYISQWFGNIYLAYFDHFVKEELGAKYYFRYCDDIVILSSNKEYLHAIFLKIKDYLDINLKLTIKKNYQIFPTSIRGIDFLGYRFYHTHTLVRKSIVKNYKRKLKHTQLNGHKRRSQLASYNGWFLHANTFNLLKKYKNETI